jgi:signal transduction histidine kinase
VINLIRNKEINVYFATVSIIGLLATFLAFVLFSYQVATFVFATIFVIISGSFIFTAWRYREIRKLSYYLRKISSGEYSLDVRDNQEGELSILKNEIYKVTLMLSQHHSLLQHEKINLTNAISDISHQLKTPLTSMMMMADLLRDPKLNVQKREEFNRKIRIQLERMEWLVSSLLKLSKIDAGTVSFKKIPVSVPKLIEKATEAIQIPIEIKQQTLHVTGEDSITFLGDMNWSAEAIINILKNSVEHTKENGEISISFSENALYTKVTIQDNGKGISKKDLPFIFKRFYKGENAADGSIGIGLALAYSIITSQGGDIEVSSTQGKGTSFHIKFYKQVI